MKNFLYYLFTLWWVLWVQVVLNHFLGGSWFSLNVVLIGILFFGMSRGPMVGQLMGLTWGLLIDASSLGIMGLHTLLYATAGFVAGMCRRQLDETKPWTQSIFTLSISVVYWLVYAGLDRFFSSVERPWTWHLVAEPLMNAIAAPILFWVMERWAISWSMAAPER